MYIVEDTLDDLLRRVFEKLLKSKNQINPTKGTATELTGVLLQIKKPRARLSRTELKGTLFSCLGELLWYLARTRDLGFISYYLPRYEEFSDDGQTIYGGYGPRLFDMRNNNQVENIIALLKSRTDSRRAVIQLFDASDLAEKHEDIPCTCTLQLLIRRRCLHMFSYMRSNDAFLGLPHDVFAFTMLQEIIARTLEVEIGTYKHAVGSLHLYDGQRESARQYLEEGWQSTVFMPPMPKDDPWPSISSLLKAESAIRTGRGIDIRKLKLDDYWMDMVRILQIYSHSKNKETDKIARLKRRMSSNIYNPYIEKRETKKHVPMKTSKRLPTPVA
jgi:thymidylate synthase